MAAGGFDQQVGQRLRARARPFGQAHQQVEAAVALDDLGDALALDHLLQAAQQAPGATP
jgi:hypothetical protein